MSEYDVVTFLDYVIVHNGVFRLAINYPRVDAFKSLTFSQGLNLLLFALDYIVAYFEDSTLVFQVFKDFGVHLQIHFEDLAKHWVEAIVKHPGLVLPVGTCLILAHFLEFLD
jgi:hypothetical protein